MSGRKSSVLRRLICWPVRAWHLPPQPWIIPKAIVYTPLFMIGAYGAHRFEMSAEQKTGYGRYKNRIAPPP